MKKIIVLLISLFLVFSCTNNTRNTILESEKVENKKLNISTSIVPIASITRYIAWDFADVKSIVPVWVSPHWFDLKASQMIDIEKSDLVVFLWLDHIDNFLDKVLENKRNIRVSQDIKLLESKKHVHEYENHEDEAHLNPLLKERGQEEVIENHEDEKEVHSVDPHVWTSSINALMIASKIKNELVALMPENKEYFENNYANFKKELEDIKNDFLYKVSSKEISEFIVFHDAYNYLFDELSIDNDYKLVFMKSVLSDPSSSEMKELIDEINIHWVNKVFREPQFKDSNLEKIAWEYNLSIFILDPLWKDSSKDWYINNYKNNLESLEKIYE